MLSFSLAVLNNPRALTRLFSNSSRMKVMALLLMPMNRLMQDSDTYAVLGMLNM